jgi:hypothetical protein
VRSKVIAGGRLDPRPGLFDCEQPFGFAAAPVRSRGRLVETRPSSASGYKLVSSANHMNGWEPKAQIGKMLPLSSSITFFAWVFCLFATLVLIGTGMSFQSQSWAEMIGSALISGGFAMAWAYAGVRRLLWMFPAVLSCNSWQIRFCKCFSEPAIP